MKRFEIFYRPARCRKYRAGVKLIAESQDQAIRIAASMYVGCFVKALTAIVYA